MKFRLFICGLLGHRSIVLFSSTFSKGHKKYIRSLSVCERCGKQKTIETEFKT